MTAPVDAMVRVQLPPLFTYVAIPRVEGLWHQNPPPLRLSWRGRRPAKVPWSLAARPTPGDWE